jgi:hypothetical protein
MGEFRLIKLLICHTLCVCAGEIIPLPWFSKELKNDLSKNNCLRGVILILLVCESIFVVWGFSFSIVPVPRYKLSLCHTPIKHDLLSFPGICIFMWDLYEVHLQLTQISNNKSKTKKKILKIIKT